MLAVNVHAASILPLPKIIQTLHAFFLSQYGKEAMVSHDLADQ